MAINARAFRIHLRKRFVCGFYVWDRVQCWCCILVSLVVVFTNKSYVQVQMGTSRLWTSRLRNKSNGGRELDCCQEWSQTLCARLTTWAQTSFSFCQSFKLRCFQMHHIIVTIWCRNSGEWFWSKENIAFVAESLVENSWETMFHNPTRHQTSTTNG